MTSNPETPREQTRQLLREILSEISSIERNVIESMSHLQDPNQQYH